jgi:outer membrane lipoprotein
MRMRKPLLLTGITGMMLLLNACATVQPFPVQANSPPLASVHQDVTAHQDQIVTWGGIILGIEVKQNDSLVTVLAKPLDKNGEPVTTDKSDGRFLARFNGFRDPAVFAVGRNLTVTGVISGSKTHKIGEYAYVYPVVVVTHYRLWPKPYEGRYEHGDYWYSPWYPYPWYPYPWYYYDYPVYHPAPPPSTILPAPQKRR